MLFPVRYHVSCDVPVKTLPLRFLWSTRRLERFVQRVFLCSKNIGFFMYFTVYRLYYNTIENSQLSFELYWVQYICMYILLYIYLCIY